MHVSRRDSVTPDLSQAHSRSIERDGGGTDHWPKSCQKLIAQRERIGGRYIHSIALTLGRVATAMYPTARSAQQGVRCEKGHQTMRQAARVELEPRRQESSRQTKWRPRWTCTTKGWKRRCCRFQPVTSEAGFSVTVQAQWKKRETYDAQDRLEVAELPLLHPSSCSPGKGDKRAR